MTIAESLKAAYEVCHPPYKGTARKYITYQLMGQTGVLYAEGTEQETGVMYSVDFYTDALPFADDVRNIKSMLAAGGWNTVVNAEIYEKDTGLHHIAMSATREGAIYG